MRKELFAVCLLALILAASLVNIYYLNQLTDDLISLVDSAEIYAQKGKWEEAKGKAEEAVSKWDQNDPYTHIVLRHSEIDSATDAFHELLKEIYTEDAAGVKGTSGAVIAHLTSISTMEHITFGSIF